MVTPEEYPIGALAMIFTEMAPEDFGRLVTSIAEEGLMDPITIWRGEVVDGRATATPPAPRPASRGGFTTWMMLPTR